MTEPLTRDAIEFALACDPAVPGNGRVCQELLAALLHRAITRPPAKMPALRQSWGSGTSPTSIDDKRLLPRSAEVKAKITATWAAKRERAAMAQQAQR